METIDKSQLHVLNKDGDIRLDTLVEQDASQIIKDNWQEAQNSNGYSDGRTMRKTASLNTVEYLNALKLGFKLDSHDPIFLTKELHRYLQVRGKDMGVQTVRNILTPGGNANIIIK